MANLSIMQRPQTLDDVYGCATIKKTFYGLVKKGKPFPTAILLQGKYGMGKSTCSKILAQMLSCRNPKENGDPCCECAACRAIIDEVYDRDCQMIDGGQAGKDDIIDRIENFMSGTAWRDKKKVLIIEEVQELSTKAKNSLLKILETKRDDVHFIFTAMENMPASGFASRCQTFKFAPAKADDIMFFLKKTMQDTGLWNDESIPDSFIREGLPTIANNSDGSYRLALQNLEQCINAELWSKDAILENTGMTDIATVNETLYDILNGTILPASYAKIFGKDYLTTFKFMFAALSNAYAIKVLGEESVDIAQYALEQSKKLANHPKLRMAVERFQQMSMAVGDRLKKAEFVTMLCDLAMDIKNGNERPKGDFSKVPVPIDKPPTSGNPGAAVERPTTGEPAPMQTTVTAVSSTGNTRRVRQTAMA